MTHGYTGAAVREPGFESIESLTQVEFAAWVAQHEGDALGRYELLNGRVVMTPPAGFPHGGVEVRLAFLLGTYLERRPVGWAFGSSQGFELPSGDTVEPDLCFVSAERWAAGAPPEKGRFLRVVPDLVFEILSASTRSRDRGEKKAIYERNGVREYWLVDTDGERLTRFSTHEGHWDLGTPFEHDQEATSLVLPGLVVPVGALFRFELP